MKIAAAAAVVVCAVIAVWNATPSSGPLLWPGARHTAAERDRAVLRGLRFLYAMARRPAAFAAWGHDLIGAFDNIAETSADPELRQTAWQMGRERALEWRRVHRTVPPGAGPKTLFDLLVGDDSAARLGAPDPPFREKLRAAIAAYPATEFMGWNPVVEPPPADLPRACARCGASNARGATECSRCGGKLTFYNRDDLYQNALIDTFTGDRCGITVGAHYRDVLRWLPAMRPWPARDPQDEDTFYSAIYTITHIVYTYNTYSLNRVDPRCFPEEFAYLRAGVPQAIADKDPETMGEFLDSLRAFGLTLDEPLLRTGFDYLLSTQNPDGSWGDRNDPDPYNRYHPTWTSIDGLREYRWKRVLPCPG